MYKSLILKSTDRVNGTTSGNDAEFNIDWGSILPDGKYRVNYSICKQKRKLPIVTVIFNSSGSFLVPDEVNTIEVFLAGAGGGGGWDTGGGGGGGQALITPSFNVIPNTTYNVVIGLGGTPVLNNNGNNGGNTSFASLISLGGQGGAHARSPLALTTPCANTAGGSSVAGYLNSIPTVPTTGFFQGSKGSPTTTYYGGAGGGAGGNALDAGEATRPIVGTGITYNNMLFCGGGGGGNYVGGMAISYGAHGGGNGTMRLNNLRPNGLDNSGGGGGGGGYGGYLAGIGGSGCCIIKYQP